MKRCITNTKEIKGRNSIVDAVRGLAILFVVLGHTMTGSTYGSEESIYFQIIWSVQMPLFMLISGYVTRYSKKELNNVYETLAVIFKKTKVYLYPWLLWTAVIRGIVFKEKSYLDFKWLVYNMDSGYWFLFSLWMIVCIFYICWFSAGKNENREWLKTVKLGVYYVMCMLVLVFVALKMGLNFLGIKLTLYYMPFYFIGFLYGKYQNHILNKIDDKLLSIIILFFAAVWLNIISVFNLYTIDDNLFGISIRFVAAVCGSIVIVSVIKKIYAVCRFHKLCDVLSWCGRYSLEIYVIHSIVLSYVKELSVNKTYFMSVAGITVVGGNYSLTLAIVYIVIKVIHSNKYLKKIIFYK